VHTVVPCTFLYRAHCCTVHIVVPCILLYHAHCCSVHTVVPCTLLYRAHCFTVHTIVPCTLFYRAYCCTVHTIVPCCMWFPSLLYYSNSCTSLHFKTLKSHTKTLKIRPYMFRSPLKQSSGGPWPYLATLLNEDNSNSVT
jgi:hypothetical protein